MRKIAFTLMAILAMTSVTYAVSFGVIANPEPASGLKSFTVQATGAGINTLGKFTIVGGVNQSGDEWDIVLSGESANPATDTCVVFGDLRIPDVGGYTWTPPYPGAIKPSKTTVETGMGTTTGTLMNLSGSMYDDYLQTGGLPGSGDTVDLLRIVMATGGKADVSLSVWAVEADPLHPVEYTYATTINAPLDGDADMNGHVDVVDLGRVGLNWGTGTTWAQGNFNGDSTVDVVDLGRLGLNWDKYAQWYVAAEGAAPQSVPEPGTIVMLVLGALCLAGYRLRK